MTRTALSALALVAAAPVLAQQAAHEHGVARLDVAVDAPRVELRLEGAGDGFVGFEHAAATDEEKAAVRRAQAAFIEADRLFAFVGAACKVDGNRVTLPENLRGDAAGHGAHGGGDHDRHDHDHDHDHDHGHADWLAELVFVCSGTPVAMDAAGLFRSFPGLREVRTQVVGEAGQTGGTLRAGAARIDLP